MKSDCAKSNRNFQLAFLLGIMRSRLVSLVCIGQSHQFVFHFSKNLFIFWTHSLVSDIKCNWCCRRLSAHHRCMYSDGFACTHARCRHRHPRKEYIRNGIISACETYFSTQFSPKIILFASYASQVCQRLRGYRKSNSRTHQSVYRSRRRSKIGTHSQGIIVIVQKIRFIFGDTNNANCLFYLHAFPSKIRRLRLKITCAAAYWKLYGHITVIAYIWVTDTKLNT